MTYLGDFPSGVTVYAYFTTHDSAGAMVAPSSAFEDADVVVYENGSATQITAGITVTSPFDSVVGLHKVEIAATTGNGYDAGAEFMIYLNPDETIDGQDANAIIGYFSIENRSSKPADVMAAGDIDGLTLEEAQKIILAATAGKSSGHESNAPIYRAADDSKDRITATTDANGNRLTITLDETG